MTSHMSDQASEIEELKAVVEGRKQDQKKLAAGMTEIEQLNQSIERCVGALLRAHTEHICRYSTSTYIYV